PEHLAVRRVDRIRPSLEGVHVEVSLAVARRVLDVPVERADPERLDRKPEVERQAGRGALRVAAEVEPARLVDDDRRLRLPVGLRLRVSRPGRVDYSDALEGGIE